MRQAYKTQGAFTRARRKRTHRPLTVQEMVLWVACLVWLAALSIAGVSLKKNPADTLSSTAFPAYLSIDGMATAAQQAAGAKPKLTIVATTGQEPAVEAAAVQAEAALRILIYHTHATEAYLMTDDAPYEESGSFRTKDNSKNVVAVGAALKDELKKYGLVAIHDTENYEPPKLSSAYSRSLTAMLDYQAQYPSVEVFIDVHRDAYGTETDVPKDFVEYEGTQTARVMFVVGTGEGATGSGFEQMPDFASNLKLAEAVTDHIADRDERLVRQVRVKTGRYNQHVSGMCLLAEVGHNANTLSQALAAVPLLAEAIADALENKQADTQMHVSAMSVWTP